MKTANDSKLSSFEIVMVFNTTSEVDNEKLF